MHVDVYRSLVRSRMSVDGQTFLLEQKYPGWMGVSLAGIGGTILRDKNADLKSEILLWEMKVSRKILG
jgi:hypothetical protein